MIAALQVATGEALLAVDISSARKRAEALPWVREAAIARRLPETLSVTVRERVPYALWQLDGTLWLMDETGTRITKRNLERFPGLPMVVGKGAGEEAAALFAMLAEDPASRHRCARRSALAAGAGIWNSGMACV